MIPTKKPLNFLAIAILFLLALLATPQEAGARGLHSVRVWNNTSSPMWSLFATQPSDRTFGVHDILGEHVLPPGGSVIVDFDDGTGSCTYDIRARFIDKSVQTRWAVNVCSTLELRFY